MLTLAQMLREISPDLDAMTAHLDGLDPTERLAQVRGLTKKDQRRLWDIVRGHRAVTLRDLVDEKPPLTGVRHEGKNSLPLFSRFAKVFYWPNEEWDTEVWGYNDSGAVVKTTVGPGYFVTHPGDDGELVIDYRMHPPYKPDGWPRILSNKSRLSRFVYWRTEDVLRGVSEHVTIGRATRNGKPLDNWFVLCRQDKV